jgi:hypothetical protein
MTDDPRPFGILAAYFRERPEGDDAIASEIVRDLGPERARALVAGLTAALDEPDATAERVHQAVARWFPPGTEAPLRWLRGVIASLEEGLAPTPRASAPRH